MTHRWIPVLIALALILGLALSPAQAAPRYAPTNPANLLVYRVGDGTSPLNQKAAPVFLDEYNQAGSLVQSIALPTTVSGTNKRLLAPGNTPGEGLLTLSADRHYVILTGYDAALGTNNVDANAATTTNRVIGRVDAAGNIDTSTALTDSTGSIRGAASENGAGFWVTSSTGGLRYAPLGAATSTQVNAAELRGVSVFGGQLYASGTSVAAVGSGLPTSAGQSLTNLPGLPAGTYHSFYLADLDASVAGEDTLYLASASGISKYSLVSGSWVAAGQIGAGSAFYGLMGFTTSGAVTLFAIRGTSELVKVVDSSGYNAAITAVPSLLAAAGVNMAFRGVAPTPQTSPTAVGLSALAAAPARLPLAAIVAGIALLSGLLLARRRK